MPWARTLGTFLGGAVLLAACSTAATPPAGSSPTASLQGISQGSPSESASAAPSGSAPAASSSASPMPLAACQLVTKADASAKTGASMGDGKEGAPKPLPQMVSHINCYYKDARVPATNVLLEVVTWGPTITVSTFETAIMAKILSKVGTSGDVTLTASSLKVAGNDGYTSLETGKGVGGVPVTVETAAYWKGQTVVSLTVGNAKLGAALELAKLVASRLP